MEAIHILSRDVQSSICSGRVLHVICPLKALNVKQDRREIGISSNLTQQIAVQIILPGRFSLKSVFNSPESEVNLDQSTFASANLEGSSI